VTLHACARAPGAEPQACPQYGLPFYLQYLARWPEYFYFAEGPGGACQGYGAHRLRCGRGRALTPPNASHGQG